MQMWLEKIRPRNFMHQLGALVLTLPHVAAQFPGFASTLGICGIALFNDDIQPKNIRKVIGLKVLEAFQLLLL
jgi:hypothetical protein